MSEVLVSHPKNEQVSQDTVQSSNAILNAFRNEMASNVIPVNVNSIKKECHFKEVSVQEQKSLSKIMISNENRKDIVYDTQCALINKLCLDEGFDIYKLTEFDRIRILMEIYQNNYFSKQITYKCKECGCENVYKLDFQKIINKFNEFSLEDATYTLEDADRKYAFTINYPMVKNVSLFYKQYMKNYKNTTNKEREILDNLGNIEYINLFIKKLELINKSTKERTVADFTELDYNTIEQILEILPQNVMFSEEEGVIKYITNEFIDKINGVFSYEKCNQCGAESKEGLGSVIDFF